MARTSEAVGATVTLIAVAVALFCILIALSGVSVREFFDLVFWRVLLRLNPYCPAAIF